MSQNILQDRRSPQTSGLKSVEKNNRQSEHPRAKFYTSKITPIITITHYIFMFYDIFQIFTVMKSIRILNDNEISLNFSLIYFMTHTV